MSNERKDGYSGSLTPGQRMDDIDERMERVVKHAAEHGKDIQGLIYRLQELDRQRQELTAHEMHCELKTKEIWMKLTGIEVEMEKRTGEFKAEMARHATRLTIYAALATFVVGLVAQWLMKRL